MDNFSVSPRKHPQRSQRVDYKLLNVGSDREAPPEDRVVKRFRSNRGSDGVELITPGYSASQLNQRQSSPADSSQQSEVNDDGQVDTSSVSSESESSRKKPQNQSLWTQFDVSALPGKLWWPKRGKGPIEDRQIRCRRCNWKTTDSARATSTSNMRFHLTKHGISLSGSECIIVRVEAKQYAKRVAQMLEKLFLLMHITYGSPARMSEISTWLLSNSVHRARSIYCHPRGLLSLGQYNKSTSMTGHERIIAHVIPREVEDIFIQYLVYIRPLARNVRNLSSFSGKLTPARGTFSTASAVITHRGFVITISTYLSDPMEDGTQNI
ncbi:hypothetical protein V1520DRAFT_351044 [Lipomyces starkeyi]|uniref:Uncharacterized protein n=1 Tax=Lipomyces starkeyi NRRL Y-11557 TaxID=675824 RepID=A0A1E3Q119_LIPST|nr:hypothetical protein LIPSTDRAFT_154895 [Lipomyces starkeyi NRRL Y-11557]